MRDGNDTVFLSFLKRERDFANVSDRLYVHNDRSTSLTVAMTVPERSRPFLTVSGTVRNVHGNGQGR